MVTIKAYGHPNVTATHKTTMEVTTSPDLSRNGDCIIGVRTIFDLPELIAFLGGVEKMEVTIDVAGDTISFLAIPNKHFCGPHELVFRRSDFFSERTVGTHATMACCDLPRDFVHKLKNPNQEILIHLEAAAK